EEDVARQITTQIRDRGVNQLVEVRESILFVLVIPLARAESLEVFQTSDRMSRRLARASAFAVPFDHDKRRATFLRDMRMSHIAERFTGDVDLELIRGKEIRN